MKKVLFVATVDSHILHFHLPYLKWFQEQGYEVHVASNGASKIPNMDRKYNIPFERSPFKIEQLKAYRELKRVIEKNNYEIIHCHTPMGSVLTRLAAKKSRKNGTTVIYTAHGFHFFKGAPVVNWLIYYPIERWLARYTDVLVTINKEDCERARGFKAKQVEYVPGVGIDVDKFNAVEVDKFQKRNELNLPQDAFVILSVGELNKNKNHEVVIRAIARINNPKVHYVICGQGMLREYLQDLSKELGIEKQVHLLGFRRDIAEICKVSDVFAFSSFREGLPVSLMEAMTCGLPVVCSRIRGNSDLIEDGKGGYLVEPNDVDGFVAKIEALLLDKTLGSQLSRFNIKRMEAYSIKSVLASMEEIYSN